MATAKFTVDAAGKVRVETSGFSGSNCQDFTKVYEQALGGSETIAYTAEYYDTVDEVDMVKTYD